MAIFQPVGSLTEFVLYKNRSRIGELYILQICGAEIICVSAFRILMSFQFFHFFTPFSKIIASCFALSDWSSWLLGQEWRMPCLLLLVAIFRTRDTPPVRQERVSFC